MAAQLALYFNFEINKLVCHQSVSQLDVPYDLYLSWVLSYWHTFAKWFFYYQYFVKNDSYNHGYLIRLIYIIQFTMVSCDVCVPHAKPFNASWRSNNNNYSNNNKHCSWIYFVQLTVQHCNSIHTSYN